MDKLTKEQVIKYLDGMDGSDPERDHGNADDLILHYLSDNDGVDIVEAYHRASCRCNGFWYA